MAHGLRMTNEQILAAMTRIQSQCPTRVVRRLQTEDEVELGARLSAAGKKGIAVREEKKRKYGNEPTTVNNVTLASKREAKRYEELLLLEKAKQIFDLKRQVPFRCAINGEHICTYVADFQYEAKNGAIVVEDTKGYKTALYSLKKKLVKACHGFEIVEV